MTLCSVRILLDLHLPYAPSPREALPTPLNPQPPSGNSRQLRNNSNRAESQKPEGFIFFVGSPRPPLRGGGFPYVGGASSLGDLTINIVVLKVSIGSFMLLTCGGFRK